MIIKNENSRRNPLIKVEIYPYLFKGYSITDNDLSITNSKFNKLSNILPRKISINNLGNKELGALITSFNYKTSMNDNGIGNFSIVFMDGKVNTQSQFFLSNMNKEVSNIVSQKISIFKYLTTDSLIKVWINDEYIMTGFIKDINYSIKNSPSKSVSISGTNVGSLLKMNMFYDKSQGGEGNVLDNGYLSQGRAYNQLIGGTIVNMTNSITDLWLNNILRNSQFKFATSAGTTNIKDHFEYEIPETANPYLNTFQWNPELWDYQGEILEYINQLVSYPFNELYVIQGNRQISAGTAYNNSSFIGTSNIDENGNPERIKIELVPLEVRAEINKSFLNNEKMYLVLRQAPFDDFRYMDRTEIGNFPGEEFKNLIEFQIEEKDVVDLNVGRSSSTQYSYFSVYLQSQLVGQDISKILFPPIYNFGALQKVGYKPLQMQLSSVELATGDNVATTVKYFQQKARQWYSYNDFYLNGTVTIKGNEKLIIGERIKIIQNEIEGTSLEAYINEYEHSWSVGKGFESKVTISRGLYKEFLELVSSTLAEFNKQKQEAKARIGNTINTLGGVDV